MGASTETPTLMPDCRRGQFIGTVGRDKTKGVKYSVYLGGNGFYYYYNGGPDPVHQHSKTLGINAEGFYGYQEINPDGSGDSPAQGIREGSEGQEGLEGSTPQLVALKRAQFHAALSNSQPTSFIDTKGRYDGRPEGIPEPLGYTEIASILACYDLGGGIHPSIPQDCSAEMYRHCA